MGSHRKRPLELGHRFDGDSPDGPCQVVRWGLNPADACGRPESAHATSAYRPPVVHGEVVEPGTDLELVERRARAVEDSGGWHYNDRSGGRPWDVIIPAFALLAIWLGLVAYVIVRWKELTP
jgi:hypothetical protein